jgi:xanthine/CO dehydrogenase XdhC/CoxF family maturation factor
MLQIAQAVSELLSRGERGALATVVRAAGSTPQEPGARLLRYEDGRTLGTVGGGRIEQVVLDTAQGSSAGSARAVLDLADPGSYAAGTQCNVCWPW